jgi:hypothetical protein
VTPNNDRQFVDYQFAICQIGTFTRQVVSGSKSLPHDAGQRPEFDMHCLDDGVATARSLFFDKIQNTKGYR